ncbi:hypothetical protein ABEB36_010726 [Hypothenemus hampei]|uniref:F-box domain-containing protein n=1 Tax=Hypothenemus hampei TaxID=57062 RepID=A0ABD1EH53_HYPHA
MSVMLLFAGCEYIQFKTTPIYYAPDFPEYVVNHRTIGLSDVLVRPLGRFHDQKPYRYQDNPFGAEYLFTFQFLRPINMTNFRMHPSWEEANVVVRIWGSWIDHDKFTIEGKWHLLYEASHSKDPSESYQGYPDCFPMCPEPITAIRIEFNRNFLMYSRVIETLLNRREMEVLSNFPLVLPLDCKVLYEGVQTLTRNVVPKIEPRANWNGENFTEALPTEILYNIFNRLDLLSLSRCAQVNKRWNLIASDLHFYQEVDLKVYWDKINGNNLGKLKDKLQIVRKLDMSWCTDYHPSFDVHAILEYRAILINILEGAKDTLTHLCLNHTTDFVSEVTMQQIFDCPNLEELRLRNNSFLGIKDWSESCNELMSLKTLDVSLSTIKENGLIEILKKTPNLEHLLMDDCNWLRNVEPIITTVVNYNPNLKSWTSSWTFYFEDNSQTYKEFGKLSHLEYLDLTNCEPVPYESSWLESVAMNCQKLKRLELGCWDQLTDEDLLPILTHCKELSHLYLPQTSKISYWTLIMACENLPNLHHICVYSCEQISKEMVEDLTERYKHVNVYRIQ